MTWEESAQTFPKICDACPLEQELETEISNI